MQQLIVRLARENPRWGYQRVKGELLHLGLQVPATAIRTALRRHGLDPAPRRTTTWRAFRCQQAAGIVACDCVTVDTIWRRRPSVLLFVGLDTRRVHLAGATANPNAAWVAQQARNLLVLGEQGRRVQFLLRDRDAKFCRAFDDLFRAGGAEVVLTPIQAPNANAFAERWVGTVRAECLDWLLLVGRQHLEQDCAPTSSITTCIGRTGRLGLGHRLRPPILMPPTKLAGVGYSGVACSAAPA